MKKLKRFVIRIENFILKKPKTMAPIAFVGFLVLASGLEAVRADQYLNQVEEYKNTAKVLSLKDSVDRLGRVASIDDGLAVNCSLGLDGLIGNVNQAYDQADDSNNPEVVLRAIHQRAMEAEPSPAFNSLLQFLPRVREARDTSEELHNALENIKNLTSEDSRSSYCVSLVDVLSEVYFVNDLRTVQGVSALRVGQLQNFQVNVNQSQELLRGIAPPKLFSNQHTAINEFLNNLRLDLQENANNYEVFSRNIQSEYEDLQGILSDIEGKSTDLLSRPEQLALYAAAFD